MACCCRDALAQARVRLQAALAAAGLGAGHRLATVLPNGAATALALLALIDRVSLMPLSPQAHSVGRVAGPEVALIDAQAAFVAEGGEGEICVRGPTVMAGYEGAAPTPHHGDWRRTGDLGRFDAEGNLLLTGRVKELINRGGEKITPLPIERAAKAVAGIADAVAFAVPHPSPGSNRSGSAWRAGSRTRPGPVRWPGRCEGTCAGLPAATLALRKSVNGVLTGMNL